MSAEVFEFPARPRSAELMAWDRYCAALVKVQDQHPILTIEAMRECVAAFDAWRVEFRKVACG